MASRIGPRGFKINYHLFFEKKKFFLYREHGKRKDKKSCKKCILYRTWR